ncbi:MAG: hypothetical protein RMK29_12660 [Myxococcales bacterium]|nr:hypothetical protein [Myxococcota bacterium]MDW8282556.1 hypothetical protein [Myxococcales bacterium]
MRRQPCRRQAAGFTLMDVLVAILVMVIGVTGLLAMQVTAINANSRARELVEATQLCQDKIEQLRVTPLPLPSPPAPGYEEVDARGCVLGTDPRPWCATLLPGPRYRRTWVQNVMPSGSIRFEVRTTWTSADNRTSTVSVSYVR